MNSQRHLFAHGHQISGECVHLFLKSESIYQLLVLVKFFPAVTETKLRKPSLSTNEKLVIWVSQRTVARNAPRPQKNQWKWSRKLRVIPLHLPSCQTSLFCSPFSIPLYAAKHGPQPHGPQSATASQSNHPEMITGNILEYVLLELFLCINVYF